MWSSHSMVRRFLLFLIIGLATAVPLVGASAVIGSLAGSVNATLGGQVPLPNTTIVSGDNLQVNDGAAIVQLGRGSRVIFGRDTAASFVREPQGVTVLLNRGFVSMFRPADSVGLRIRVGEISVIPAAGFKTLGEVAMVNGAVVVTAKEGSLLVEGNGPAVEVTKGKTVSIQPKVARAPAGAGGAAAGAAVGGRVGATMAVQAASVAASAAGATMAGVATVRAGDAKDAAQAAQTAAQAAVTNATAATTAANQAKTAVNNVGNALNTIARDVLGVKTSPFTPAP